MRGIIALDIDGTITSDHHLLSTHVKKYLEDLAQQGWILFFITGRIFKWVYEVVQQLDCKYYLGVQNGAIILEMPSRKIIAKKYFDTSIFPVMEEICKDEPTDFVLYSGYENNDIAYYRLDRFMPSMHEYVYYRQNILGEKWQLVESFDKLPVREFASMKCFGHYDSASRITRKIEQILRLHVPLIRDPFNPDYYVVQATHPQVSKGFAIDDLKKNLGKDLIVIAGGDDYNDMTMLAAADIKIVMASAPEDLQFIADVIAPPASEDGIIQGLKEAISLISE